MQKYLPSKRFIYILLSIIIALGIIWVFSYLKHRENTPPVLTESEARAKVQEFIALDSDGDGMKDWEEALWKTDPKLADTDNDGTNDGDEVMVNRDPLKQNVNPTNQEPSDRVDPKIIAEDKKVELEYSQLTATEKISRDLFSQYIATRKLDSPLSATDQMQIVEQTIKNLPEIVFKTYSFDEIKIINSTENNILRDYTNSIAKIILTNLKTPIESIDDVITDFSNINTDTKFEEQTKKIFARLSPLVEKNKKTIDSLLEITVPQTFQEEHLDLLNAFQSLYITLSFIQNSSSDIVILIPLLSRNELNIQILSDALQQITQKIISLKIDFVSKEDYGYQLFGVIISGND